MRKKLKHLPMDQWPVADIEAFAKAYEPGDIFEDTAGPGALAQKTRRGLQGRVLQGLSGGGVCYGYDLLPGETGVRRINENEAKVIRSIFADYAAGQSPQAIARKLNKKGITGPFRRTMAGYGNTRALYTRHRDPQQRALCRPSRLATG